MQLPIYQVDAFADKVFQGNPAAVVPLTTWLETSQMQAIAAENNLSETAFFLPLKAGYQLRWFTPKKEVRLCGHATLAAAHVLFRHLGFKGEIIQFHTASGPLLVRQVNGGYQLDFPADQPVEIPLPPLLEAALQVKPDACFQGLDDLLVLLPDEQAIRALQPDFSLIAQLPVRGVLATAPGEQVDFVSRCFFPQYGINEDPVTGSAHTLLTPYWAKRLQKNTLTAQQLSDRGGTLKCTLQQDRVLLQGSAITYLTGIIHL